jgi:hypothetical protein
MASDPREAELLEAAGVVLARAGFKVRIEPLGEEGFTWLLAEDDLFAIAVLAGSSLAELREIETEASGEILDRLGGMKGGPKRWDVYLVFLTPQRWTSVDDRERMEFAYDTRGIRRLIGAQVVAEEGGGIEDPVEGVLRPFLPLVEPIGTGVNDLDLALGDALVLNGVDEERASAYVEAFRARGHLDDV